MGTVGGSIPPRGNTLFTHFFVDRESFGIERRLFEEGADEIKNTARKDVGLLQSRIRADGIRSRRPCEQFVFVGFSASETLIAELLNNNIVRAASQHGPKTEQDAEKVEAAAIQELGQQACDADRRRRLAPQPEIEAAPHDDADCSGSRADNEAVARP